MAQSSAETLAMQGMMMKKKTSTPSILRPLTLEWVTRHFFLYENGKMIYARDGASVNPDEMVLLCNNIADCRIDRAKASDMGKKKSHVANSFYLSVPQDDDTEFAKNHKKRTLLVTHGPDDFKKWIMAFRRLKATINLDVEGHLDSSAAVSPAKSDIPKEVTSKGALDVSTLKMSDAKFGDSAIIDVDKLTSVEEKHTNESRGSEIAEISTHDIEKDEEQLAVHFSDKDEVISVPGSEKSGSEKEERPIVKKEKSVSFDESSMGEVIPDVDQLSESSGGSEKKGIVSFADVRIADTTVIDEPDVTFERKVSFRTVRESAETAKVINEQEPEPEKKVSFRTVKEAVDNAELIDDGPALEKKVSFRMEDDSDNVAEDEIPAAQDLDEGILFPAGCKNAKVFAYGDSLDELTSALPSGAVVYGIVTTSLEETMDDESYANATPQQSLSKLKAFSIEFLGETADPIKVEKFEQHLCEIIPYCKSSSNLNDLHPIRCGNGQKAIDEILSVLQVIEDDNDEEEKVVSSASDPIVLNFDYDTSSGLTAYKYALKTYDHTDIPNGLQVLECVRQQMGVPYNWVLYQPSQTELIVEDAGSGGVIEMTKVLKNHYNDRVLFGLARVSFMGETFGRRQIWFALEWTGENCTSVKMIRQLRDSATKMNEFIGDRSFTMTNVSADDMSPDAVCSWVKRSCDVNDFTLSVDSMNSAHIEEQKVIREYYEKLAEKEAAIRSAKEARRKEQLRKERLWIRQETRENAEPLREERKQRWSKMNVPTILKDLGDRESLSGWVLLEIDT